MDFNSWNIFWSLRFGLLTPLIVVGNILTMWIFLKQRRRKRAYFFLISLAAADLLVGLLAIPLYMADHNTASVRHMFNAADIFTSISSIYTLAVISLERMIAIGWPFRHRTLNFRIYICAIVIPWIVAGIFTTIITVMLVNIIKRVGFLYLYVLCHNMPLLAMCVGYCVVWKKQKSPMGDQNHVHVRREAKLAKTLLMITGASLFTWLPFQITMILFHLNVIVTSPHLLLIVFIAKFLQFTNSLVNVIIYPCRIPEFKNALMQILRCCVVPFARFNSEIVPIASSGSVVSLIRFTNSQFLSANFIQESTVWFSSSSSVSQARITDSCYLLFYLLF